MQDKILSTYTGSIYKNLSQIKSILGKLGIRDEESARRFQTILQQSNSILVEKWLSGKKYYKTKFAVEAFKEYPKDVIELSLFADAITCILDDFFDEPLTNESRALYVIEAGRVLANLFSSSVEEEISKLFGNYFNTLIIIGTMEHNFYDLIQSEKDDQQIKKYMELLFDVRALDIDLFFQLPLLRLEKTDSFANIVKSARAFRALNLLNKDLKDLEYDRQKGNRTIFTILRERKSLLVEGVRFLVQKYLGELENLRSELDTTNLLYRMGKREEKNISQFTNM